MTKKTCTHKLAHPIVALILEPQGLDVAEGGSPPVSGTAQHCCGQVVAGDNVELCPVCHVWGGMLSDVPEQRAIVGLIVQVDLDKIEVEKVDVDTLWITTAERTLTSVLFKCYDIQEEGMELMGRADAQCSAGKGAGEVVVEVPEHRVQGKDLMQVRVTVDLISVVVLPGQAAGMANEGKELRGIEDTGSGHGGVCAKQK